MGVNDLAGLDDDGHVPGIGFNQGLDRHGEGEQGRNRGVLRVDATVTQHNQLRPVLPWRQQFPAQIFQPAAPSFDPAGRQECEIHTAGGEFLRQAIHLPRIQQGRTEHSLLAQVHTQRHHMGLAQGINGRVRDLREALLAVVP